MTPESGPRPTRILHVTLACLAIALAAMMVFRALPKPWEGSTGRAVYGETSARDTGAEKWMGALNVISGKVAPARELRTGDWVTLGLWFGALGFAAIFVILGASAFLWLPASRPPPGAIGVDLPGGWNVQRWSMLVLLAALALAGGIRWPWLDRQILWDEQDNLRRNFHGYYQWTDPGAEPEWIGAGPRDAFWENRRGNNPHLFSILSWSSNEAWRKITGSPRERYSITATRMPSAVFGWLAIIALWWALNAVGLPRAAPIAALLAAVHPLWSEYAIQARGYALTLCFVPMMLAFAWRFLMGGRWRDMAGMAASSLVLLISYPGSLYFVGVIQACAIAIALADVRKDRGKARQLSVRWLIANTITAAVFLWLMAPILPQTAAVMENSFQRGNMPAHWFLLAHNLYATGLHFQFDQAVFFGEDPAAPGALAWLAGDFFRMPGLALWSLLVFPLMVGAGLWSWWKSNARLWLGLAVPALGSGMLCAGHNALVTGCYIYPWYMIFTLPVFLAAFAAGLDLVAARIAPNRAATPRTLIVGAAATVCWLLFSHPFVRPHGWQSLYAQVNPRPSLPRWPDPHDTIGKVDFTRGHALWVNYADGYQINVPAYTESPEKWQAVLARPVARYGLFR